MLTNRKTGERFLANKDSITGKIVKQRFFATPAPQYDLNEFIADVSNRFLRNLPGEERVAIIDEMRTQCEMYPDEIFKIINQRELLFNVDQKSPPTAKETVPFEESILQALGGLLFSSAFPSIGLMLTLLPAVAAQSQWVLQTTLSTDSACLYGSYLLEYINQYQTFALAAAPESVPSVRLENREFISKTMSQAVPVKAKNNSLALALNTIKELSQTSSIDMRHCRANKTAAFNSHSDLTHKIGAGGAVFILLGCSAAVYFYMKERRKTQDLDQSLRGMSLV